MAAHTLEGRVYVTEECVGHYEITVAGDNVAEWATSVAPGGAHVKAVLMVEDSVFLEAQGKLSAHEGEYGYSSWTPGSGPTVELWEDASYTDIADALEAHDGCVVALSLEVID